MGIGFEDFAKGRKRKGEDVDLVRRRDGRISAIGHYIVVVVLVYKNAPYKQTKEELSVWSMVVCAPCREELFSKLSDFLGQ